MHKSKNYDMATQVAMDKLMPKPIQITISMQGGGGLRGLGERPISSVYGRPIPRTIYRQYGGGAEFGLVDDVVEGAHMPWDYTDTDTLQDDSTPAPLPTRPTPNRPEDLATSPEGSSIRQGTKGWTTRGFLNAFGVPFHPDRPTPRQEYAPKWQPQIQGIPQPMGSAPTQPLPPAQLTAPIDQRSTEVIAAQDFVDRFLTPEDRNLPPINVEKLAGLPGGISGLFRSIDEGRWGVAVKDMADRNLHKGVAALKAMQDVKRDEEYFRRKKGGGGLSSVKKSMNINGQPHSLAWINPGEASALKAMGGSGKKVEGIPAYFVGGWDEEVSEVTGGSAVGGEGQYVGAAGDPYTYESPTEQPSADISYTDYELGGMGGYSPTQVKEFTKTASKSRATGDDDTGYMAGPKELTDMRKGILGLYGDRMTRGEALEGAKRSAFTTWRNTVGKYSLDTPKDYDEWFAKQDPNALIAGYKIGDPVGMAMQSSFDIVNKKLKKRFEEKASQKSEYTDEELTREELGEIVKSAEVEGLEDFTEYSEIDYPAWMPGGLAIKALGFLSRTVIGTGTVGGIGVHLHKDGSVTPISPEDSPGFDHESMKGENVEPIKRRRVPPPPAPADTLPPEDTAPAKGTMAELLARRGPTSKSGLQNLKNILASTHPGRDFNIG